MIKKVNIKYYLALILIFSIYIFYLNNVGENVIFMDQIRFVNEFIEPLYNHTLTFSDLIYTKSGHMILGYHLIFIINTLFFNLNTMLEANVAAIILFIGTIILTRYYLNNFPIDRNIVFFSYTTLILVIFGLGKWSKILLSMGIQDSIEFLFIIVVCILLDKIIIKRDFSSKIKILLIIISSIHLVFFSIDTFIGLYFVIFFIISLMTVFNFIINKKVSKFNIIYLLTISSGILFQLMYIIANNKESIKLLDFSNMILFYIRGLASFLINQELARAYLSDNFILILGLITASIFFASIIIYLKNKMYKQSLLPLLLIAHSLSYLTLVTIGRSSYGDDVGMASRYGGRYMTGLIGVIWIFVHFYIFNNKTKNKKIIIIGITLIFIGSLLTSLNELKISKFRASYMDKRVELAITHKIDETNYKMFQGTNPDYVSNAFKILDKYDLNVYSNQKNIQHEEKAFRNLDLKTYVGKDINNLYKGSYVVVDKENDPQVWVRKESQITLEYKEGDSFIRIKGYIPYNIHKKANRNVEEFNLKFLINGKEVDDFSVTKNTVLNHKIKIDENILRIIDGNSNFDFKIIASHEVNPKKAGIGKDIRDLSFIVSNISVEKYNVE